ncbi:N-acetyl-gamma-glutamyl-phosphate reductase [Parashewanella curva]|uniref:N-acetyl-gamma-glutamyl-phosphate reductase n=1 Tax=Parashewanella curva TaxID=2338552 RepID=UPI001FB54078|nr:N-acetyl-gamma-glutamyl-phosphate reductase [Parashewanella curva]
MQIKDVKTAVVGASGYAGAELVELLTRHQSINSIELLVSESSQVLGQCFSDVFPRWKGVCDTAFQAVNSDWINQHAAELDVVFLATPHAASVKLVKEFTEHEVIIFDLSGGFRLKQPELYDEYYGFTHQLPEVLQQAVYGSPEWEAESLKDTNLIAVPGCYPTASLLGLKPITSNHLHDESSLITVNGISGVSGAGRQANLATSFNEVSLTPYNILKHRHQPEMSQAVQADVIFNPHLAPFKRGLLATTTLKIKEGVAAADIDAVYKNAYQSQPLIRFQKDWPKIDNVTGTPFADIHWQFDEKQRVLVVSCAIDNLMKGAASQAVQCLNLRLGLSSEFGLLSNVEVNHND